MDASLLIGAPIGLGILLAFGIVIVARRTSPNEEELRPSVTAILRGSLA